MKEENAFSLKLDISQAENGIIKIEQDLDSLKTMAKEIGSVFSSAFDPLITSLGTVTAGISNLSTALTAAIQNMQQIIILASTGNAADGSSGTPEDNAQLAELLNPILDGTVSSAIGVIAETVINSLIPVINTGDAKIAAIILATVAALAAIAIIWTLFGTEITDTCSSLLDTLGEICWNIFNNVIVPVSDWIIQTSNDLWIKHLQPLWYNLCNAVSSIGTSIHSLWENFLKPVIKWIMDVFGPAIITVIDVVISEVGMSIGLVADVINGIIVILDGVIQFISGVFTLSWADAWKGVVKIFEGIFVVIGGIVKGVLNVIILAINLFIGALYSVITGVINALSGVVETMGTIVGKKWGFRVPTNPPQVPMLAKGAVLPANRPFMAIVGDQRHGTNVEAPLSVIQEAVALVMEDQTAAIVSGFNASIGVQREILGAVLGIQIGDEMIAAAADRYRRKMAVMKGV